MKVTGFTFIRNALIYDYPIVESITSILSICDRFVVAVGNSNDQTLDLIKSIDPQKIEIIETVWNDNLREGGAVLAEETNKAFRAIVEDSDWAFYIQGDEVIHEKYLETIKNAMLRYKDDKRVDGLLFKYLHFYGSYDYIGASSMWYRNEIRVIRNDKSIYSYRDAQGFRKGDNEKLSVIPVDAYVYHYGWVREPAAMQKKQESFNRLWHNDQWIDENVFKADEFDYGNEIRELKKFTGDHPAVIKNRIKAKNWNYDHDLSINTKKLKDKVKDFLYTNFGLDFNYKNYILLKIK